MAPKASSPSSSRNNKRKGRDSPTDPAPLKRSRSTRIKVDIEPGFPSSEATKDFFHEFPADPTPKAPTPPPDNKSYKYEWSLNPDFQPAPVSRRPRRLQKPRPVKSDRSPTPAALSTSSTPHTVPRDLSGSPMSAVSPRITPSGISLAAPRRISPDVVPPPSPGGHIPVPNISVRGPGSRWSDWSSINALPPNSIPMSSRWSDFSSMHPASPTSISMSCGGLSSPTGRVLQFDSMPSTAVNMSPYQPRPDIMVMGSGLALGLQGMDPMSHRVGLSLDSSTVARPNAQLNDHAQLIPGRLMAVSAPQSRRSSPPPFQPQPYWLFAGPDFNTSPYPQVPQGQPLMRGAPMVVQQFNQNFGEAFHAQTQAALDGVSPTTPSTSNQPIMMGQNLHPYAQATSNISVDLLSVSQPRAYRAHPRQVSPASGNGRRLSPPQAIRVPVKQHIADALHASPLSVSPISLSSSSSTGESPPPYIAEKTSFLEIETPMTARNVSWCQSPTVVGGGELGGSGNLASGSGSGSRVQPLPNTNGHGDNGYWHQDFWGDHFGANGEAGVQANGQATGVESFTTGPPLFNMDLPNPELPMTAPLDSSLFLEEWATLFHEFNMNNAPGSDTQQHH